MSRYRSKRAPWCCEGSSSAIGTCETRCASRGRLPVTHPWSTICPSKWAGVAERAEPCRDGLNRIIVERARHTAHDEVVGGVMRQIVVKAGQPCDEIQGVLPAQRRIGGVLTRGDRGSSRVGAVASLARGNAARRISHEKQGLPFFRGRLLRRCRARGGRRLR